MRRMDVWGVKRVFGFNFCKQSAFVEFKVHLKRVSLGFPADYPSNQQFIKHFPEFLRYGYRPHLGAIETKYPYKDGSRAIQPHTVGVVDGFCKIIIMMSIVGFCKELELTETDLEHPTLQRTLASFVSIACSYAHFQHPGHHYLYSLSLLDCNRFH